MNKAQAIVKHALLAFVLVSIGFALGKEATTRRYAAAAGTGAGEVREKGDKVVVYYLHTTFRCVTCNGIERLAKQLVETQFADALAAGRVEWREANFQLDEAFAKRYGVVSGCVVVARFKDGREIAFDRLDEVWTRYQNPADFNAYVGAAIRRHLGVME